MSKACLESQASILNGGKTQIKGCFLSLVPAITCDWSPGFHLSMAFWSISPENMNSDKRVSVQELSISQMWRAEQNAFSGIPGCELEGYTLLLELL